jgi:hypothetical protein
MKPLLYGRDITAKPLTAPAKAPIEAPAALQIVVEPKLRIEEEHLVATAELRNTSDAPQQIILTGPRPFVVNLGETTEIEKHRPGGRLANARLEALDVPPKATVLLIHHTPLTSLFYKGTPTVTLPWQFMRAGDPLYGHFSVKLPKRKSPDSYFVEGEPVSKSVFERREKELSGQVNWACEKTTRGGRTSWVAKDKDGRRFNVVYDQFGEWSLHDIFAHAEKE